jgi:two-component system phosphate regulon sensor histidine kinase PhoR
MRRSSLFWRLFGTCGVVWLLMIAVLAAVMGRRGEAPQTVWAAAAAAGLAALLLALWLAQRISEPLRDLTRAVEEITDGRFGQKIYAPHSDEVASLAVAFNRMSASLAARFAAVEEDRHQLRTILSGMAEGVIALDGVQRVLFANERAAQLLEFPSPPVGRKLWEVVRVRPLLEAVRKALASPDPCREEVHWGGPGSRSLTVHAARLPGPAARGAVIVLQDTSELRRLERMRQEFVANVSHELKTPLSVIKACVETLLDGAVDDPAHRGSFLEQIADQADRLHALILDLLSLARIEAGEEVLTFQAVPLAPVVDECLERHRARAEAKAQQLESGPTCPDGDAVPLAAWADEEAVSQILDNLVDNAVKYTPHGGQIRVCYRPEGEQVCLEVSDNGIGIPEADLPRIFERFYRVDKARSREVGGTGLGLSIVKHLAQALHGSVGATSRVVEGTTFTVRLPRSSAA